MVRPERGAEWELERGLFFSVTFRFAGAWRKCSLFSSSSIPFSMARGWAGFQVLFGFFLKGPRPQAPSRQKMGIRGTLRGRLRGAVEKARNAAGRQGRAVPYGQRPGAAAGGWPRRPSRVRSSPSSGNGGGPARASRALWLHRKFFFVVVVVDEKKAKCMWINRFASVPPNNLDQYCID